MNEHPYMHQNLMINLYAVVLDRTVIYMETFLTFLIANHMMNVMC